MKLYLYFLVLIVVMGCGQKNLADQELARTAVSIDSTLTIARNDILVLQKKAEDLFQNSQKYEKGLFPNRQYKTFSIKSDPVFYNPVDDGGNAVWASLIHPLTKEENRRIRILEYLEEDMKTSVKNCPFVVQTYFLTSFSAVSCYPFFDTITFLTPKMDFTRDFQTYYEADIKHNPQRKEVWVKPYLDVSGNGYMVSVIAPVYYDNEMIGTIASDLPISKISENYLNHPKNKLMIVTDSTLVMAVNKQAVDFLQIEGLEKFFYTERAEKDVSVSDKYKLIENEMPEIRKLGMIIMKGEGYYKEKINNKNVQILVKRIPELKWYLVQIIVPSFSKNT